ncbi:unnamed protein product [Pedinophyceae sp. YPF-701]|nr:unnamed protein product [Pedinophyceae sp. YPF-701]
MDADFDGFLEKVSEATRLVEGLKEGKINPEYVDKITQADAEKKRKEQEKVEAEERERADPERQARLQAKVEEIKANMERKRRARERYEARQAEKRAAQGGAVRAGGPTDYESWDLWTPSDEEDELVNSMLPQGAEFKAMEKDIEERHKRMTEARQAAERARVRGNAEFKRGNWAGAYQEYCDGLAREKTNMALHGNAAMAAIKRGCFVQAVDHCDRVVHLAEFLHERPRDPLVVKAYQRRATARSALGHLREAVADLEKAVEIEPGNAEAAGQLARAREVLAEDQRARRAAAAARGEAGADDAALDAQAAQEMRMLRELERLAGAVRGSAGPVTSAFDPLSKGKGGGRRGGGAQDVSDVLAELAKLVRESEACRVHVRACGGLEAVSDWTRAQLEGGGCAPGLRCLEAASYNDFNGEWLQEHGVLDSVARALPGLLAGARADAESGLQLLLTSSTAPAVRQAVSAALAAGDGAPALTAVLAAAASTTKANATAALALALLAQTAVDAPVRAAIAARTTQLAAALARWLDAPKGGAARDWPQAERAAACAGNVLGDAVVRGAVARSSPRCPRRSRASRLRGGPAAPVRRRRRRARRWRRWATLRWRRRRWRRLATTRRSCGGFRARSGRVRWA